MSLSSRITKFTQNFGIFADVPWQHGFPEGSNANAIGESGIPTTRQVLSFHLRRAALSLAHGIVRRYGDISTSKRGRRLSRLVDRFRDIIQPFHDKDERTLSLEELSNMSLIKLPRHIAVSLQLARSIDSPGSAETADPVDILLEQAADLVSWVALTSRVERLTIYEETDALHKIDRDKLEFTIRERAKATGYPTKEIDISFLGENHIVASNILAVVFATDVLQGKSCQAKFGIMHPDAVGVHLLGCEQLPDLFISFNSESNGFPLAALNNALIYEARPKGALNKGDSKLRDFVQALKTFDDSS